MNDPGRNLYVTNDGAGAGAARETLEEVTAGNARATCPRYFRHELAVSPIEKRSMKSEMRSSPDRGIIASRLCRKRGEYNDVLLGISERNRVFSSTYLCNNIEATLKDLG